MVWNTNAGRRTVYASVNGEERTFDFDGTTPLKDAVSSVAKQLGLGAVLVQSDGRNVEPDEGDKPISEMGRVDIIPKNAGAALEIVDLEGYDSEEEDDSFYDADIEASEIVDEAF